MPNIKESVNSKWYSKLAFLKNKIIKKQLEKDSRCFSDLLNQRVIKNNAFVFEESVHVRLSPKKKKFNIRKQTNGIQINKQRGERWINR